MAAAFNHLFPLAISAPTPSSISRITGQATKAPAAVQIQKLPEPLLTSLPQNPDLNTNFPLSLACALHCPHFESCSSCTDEYNLHHPAIVDEASEFFKELGVSDFTFDTCRLLHLPNCQLSNLPLSLTYVNFTSLRVLNLSYNYFNSTMPRWLFNLSTLTHLDFNQNSLHGAMPDELAKLTSLQKLDLSYNLHIQGELPRHLGNNLCKLEILSLHDNNITRGITEFIEGISECGNNSLLTLDLRFNNLIGYLPDSLGSLKNLRHLLLQANLLTGSIPKTIGSLSFLKELDLSYNQMSGTIPESLGKLSSLVSLSLDNNWEGVITERHLVNLSSLQEIHMLESNFGNNNIPLVFNISPNWIPPFKLKSMSIYSCRIGSEFPAWLSNQNELTSLEMVSAGISGFIPDWFLNLGLRFKVFRISNNNLSGKVPNSLQFTFDSSVDVSFNHFEGPLPLWSSNVSYLSLKGNLFSGPIPTNLGLAMPYLRELDISKNYLNGSVPLSIGNLTRLSFLVISYNQLSGNIPNFWSCMPLLSVLDMSNNNLLSGKIPSSIGYLYDLEFLILSGNNLSGELPFELRNLSILKILDLNDNKLSGRIPTWIGESMRSLRVLSLRNNFLTEHVPSQICNLSNLIVLDLSNNILSGIIPPCFGDLSALESDYPSTEFIYQGGDYVSYEAQIEMVTKGTILHYDSTLYLVKGIDLSNNNLSGNIPVEMMNLSNLGILNLSINHLTGGIPERIGMLRWLETLDLSRNKLSGPIPETLAEMTFLSHLNLSYNNLSGRIPSGKQLQVLNDPTMYLGNEALCGQPLPECVNYKNTSFSSDIEENGESNKLENLWFYLVIGSGYFLGFWGFWYCLIFKKQWRIAYFRFVERLIRHLFGKFKMCN